MRILLNGKVGTSRGIGRFDAKDFGLALDTVTNLPPAIRKLYVTNVAKALMAMDEGSWFRDGGSEYCAVNYMIERDEAYLDELGRTYPSPIDWRIDIDVWNFHKVLQIFAYREGTTRVFSIWRNNGPWTDLYQGLPGYSPVAVRKSSTEKKCLETDWNEVIYHYLK